MKATLFCIVVLVGIICVNAQIEKDRVLSLPNLRGNLGVQYSGYINVNTTHGRYLHYWFVQSQRSTNDPVVLWLNGGPGCSSLDGFLYENGPFKWAAGVDTVDLIQNPHSWNKVANVIYLESPAGVGFSYSNNKTDYTDADDTQTAEDNFNFLVKFFTGFPQFKNNDFYIAGESYAGIYVPTLANRVVVGNLKGQSNIKLKGILVGNGVTDPRASADMVNEFPFAYSHALYSTQTQELIQKYCGSNPNGNQCQQLTNQVYSVFGDIQIYDIYATCYHQRPPMRKGFKIDPKLRKLGDIPCVDSHKADIWLNTAAVKTAMHVRQDITWSICNDEINEMYTNDIQSTLPIYHNLIGNGTRILIFSGDVDASVPFTGTQYWTSQLMGLPLKSLWKPWKVGQQVAGFVTQYQGLDYVTVKGAGHMVPQFKPAEAFVMFSKFLQGQNL